MADQNAAHAAKLMKSPEFMAMFQKAMGDDPIPEEGDPKRAEWLRKMQDRLAAQQKEEEKKKLETPVTDDDGTWMYIRPEPGFCLKCTTTNKAKKEKVFINICKHDQISEPTPMDPSEFDDNDAELKEAIRFRIPLSCNAPKPDRDKAGNPCQVVDVVVNTLTIKRCGEDSEFRRFVAALSMSWVQQKHIKTLDTDQFTNVNFKCKGTPDIQRIHLRKKSADGAASNAMNDDIQLPKTSASGTAPIAPKTQGRSGKMVMEVDPDDVEKMRTGGGGGGGAAPAAAAAAAAAAASASDGAKQKPKPPTFIVAKVGSYDWSKHQKPTKNPYFHETVPDQVAVEVELEQAQSIKEVDVRIGARNAKQLELRWVDDADEDEDCEPFLTVPLGYPVDEDAPPVSAKFSKKSKTLTLRFQVRLPDEVELEERRAAEARAEQEKEEKGEAAKRRADEKAIEDRRAKFDRMQREEEEVMAQRKEYVENLRAVQEGAIPPALQQEIDKMDGEQARVMLMRLETKTRNGDGIDDMLDKMPEDVIFSVCNCIRAKLKLEPKKRPAAEVAASKSVPQQDESSADGAPGDREYNFAKKAENLFGVKMYNRYIFALDH